MPNKFSSLILPIALAGMLAVTGCATPKSGKTTMNDDNYGYVEDSDPIEPFNRAMFGFNKGVDSVVVRPVATVYRGVVPAAGRRGVSNFLTNLTSPVVFLNALLQGDGQQAFTAFWRFVLNTTFGFAGVRDFAGENGLKYRDEDFGQTLGVYGVGPGPYIVLPFFGPSSLRDTTGLVVDTFSDPMLYLANDYWNLGRKGAEAVDFRSRNMKALDDIYRNSIDPYAIVRSAYLQRREAEIRNNAVKSPLGN